MTVRGIDHVGIAVASLEAALGFYRDLLGLRVTDEGQDGERHRHGDARRQRYRS